MKQAQRQVRSLESYITIQQREIIGQTGDWYLIKSGDVTGYVSKDYFVTGAQAEELAAEVGDDVATVNTETLMVRKKASTDSDVIALVGDSQRLQVIDQEDGWVKVAVDNDVVGYVSSDYVDCETKFVEAESIETSTAREEAVQSALDRADQMKEAKNQCDEQCGCKRSDPMRHRKQS